MVYFRMANLRLLLSDEYNWSFNLKTGCFLRCGKTVEEDPPMSPFGPEIVDIEISAGKCSGNCSWCYKSNSAKAEIEYMSFETYKMIFDKLPKNVTQIAFGITDLTANPDIWKIMEYTRENEVIPNITINGINLTDYQAERLAYTCGAVAVSCYNTETCFNAVEKLNRASLKRKILVRRKKKI